MIDATKSLTEARATAGAQERARLAREIHDGVAQDLAGLGYRLDDLATASGIAPSERGQIREIRIALSETLNRLRYSIFDLRNPDFDLLTQVRGFLNGIESVGVNVSTKFNCDTSTLDPVVARELRFIAIEALSNVVRHSNATRLEFGLIDCDNFLQMTITDNGVGNAGVKDFSYGLATMNERAQLIGATCTIESPKSGGTIISVQAPRR